MITVNKLKRELYFLFPPKKSRVDELVHADNE